MRLVVRSVVVIGAVFATFSGSQDAKSALPADASANSAADAFIHSEMEKLTIPGLSLAVIRAGKLVYAQGYGLANAELEAPARSDTVYQLQSVTKTFTATGIMMLVQDGRLGLDDPVSEHLAGTPDSWNTITIRHLLSHTSGIKDFINEPTASLRLDVTEKEVLRATAVRPLNFPPGEQYAYSNTNYHLLAMMIRQVSGKSYGDFLRERIFDPLEMHATRVYSLADVIPHRAAGYLLYHGKLRNGEFIAPSILGYGGGGLLSTVLDLAKWDAALHDGKLLDKALLEQMWTPTRLNNGQTSGYGLGWFVLTDDRHRRVWHTGSHATGFQSIVMRYLDDGLTVIVLANRRPLPMPSIAEHIAGLYDPALAPPAVPAGGDR